MPSRISAPIGSRSAAGGGGGSGRRIPPRNAAETTNEQASTAIAIGAVSSFTRNPAAPNARNSIALAVAASAPLARTSSARETMVGRYALSATSKKVVSTAASDDTSSTWASVSQPPTAARGMDPSSTALPRSAQIITGRRRRRSTQAPATNPTRRAAMRSAARSAAISMGPARRVSIATNGSAMRVTNEPKTETVAALHRSMNARLRRSPGEGSSACVGGTGIEQRVEGHRRSLHVSGPSAGGARARHGVHSARLGVARTRAPPARRPPCGLIPTISHKGPRPRMFDTLSDRLRKTLAGLTGRGRVTEADLDAAMREVRLALLEADVNFKVVKDFVARVRERALGAEILESLTAGQQVVKIVNEELTALLSAGDRTFRVVGNPAVIALVGLQGSGKTTSAAKLAKHIVKLGRAPLLVAADPYRPAAADQLETLGKSLNIAVYRAPVGTPTVDIARQGIEHAKRIGRDTVIIDTAGRLTIDDALMAEIRAVADATRPVETLLVVDAMTGQEAVTVAQGFAGAVPVTGLVLTKIDGDARGGAALSIGAVTGIPVKFLGTGEKTDALEVFYPDRLAGRILGMGDVLTLVERAQEAFDEKQTAKLEEQVRKGAFTLEDMLSSMRQMQKMGPMGQLMGMIPGMSGMANEAQAAVDRGDLRRVEAIILSMTPRERRDPGILNASRRRRIANGSGTSLPEVNRLVKQFGEMQKLMKQLSGTGGRRAAMGQLLGRR